MTKLARLRAKGYSQVPHGAYSVVSEVRAKPGKEAELRAATLPLVELVLSDPKKFATLDA